MNSQQTTLLITSILAFTLLSGSITVGNVYATGGMDDEEEEEAIEELQNEILTLNEALGNLELNLNEGANNIQANCPTLDEIVQVIENQTQQPEQNQTEGCNPIPEEPVPEQPPATVIPDINVTEPVEECNPVPEEPEPEQNQSVLEPIICPINGELLGYKNVTSGELLPISAGNETQVEEEEEEPQTGNNNTGGFLPPIDIPEAEANEEEPAQTVTPTEEPETPQCNVTSPEEPLVEEPVIPEEVEFNDSCGCFVKDSDGDQAITEGLLNNESSEEEEEEEQQPDF